MQVGSFSKDSDTQNTQYISISSFRLCFHRLRYSLKINAGILPKVGHDNSFHAAFNSVSDNNKTIRWILITASHRDVKWTINKQIDKPHPLLKHIWSRASSLANVG